MKKKFLGLLTKCKDEPFVYEFCKYYISQGVDKIYILDDDSFDKSIYDTVKIFENVEIIYINPPHMKGTYPNHIEETYSTWYQKLKDEFIWIINVDIDEFITTRKNSENTIKDELITTFKDVDCIKIPWVFMSFNSIEKNPESILNINIHRWNHDKKHSHSQFKFRCRYNKIEVKCIFKTEKFNKCKSHTPIDCNGNVITVNSINASPANLSIFHEKLREVDIEDGFLLCYHYRINSIEHALSKLKHNKYYNPFSLEDLIEFDYPEILDDTLKNKYSLIY